jgi:hypothetical protein
MLLRFAREAYARLAVVEGRLEIEKIFFVTPTTYALSQDFKNH